MLYNSCLSFPLLPAVVRLEVDIKFLMGGKNLTRQAMLFTFRPLILTVVINCGDCLINL